MIRVSIFCFSFLMALVFSLLANEEKAHANRCESVACLVTLCKPEDKNCKPECQCGSCPIPGTHKVGNGSPGNCYMLCCKDR